MAGNKPPVKAFLAIEPAELQALIDALRQQGYRTIGPRVQDGAVRYDDLTSIDELPVGFVDHQDAGMYRLEQTDDAGYFNFAAGPDSLKKYLLPPCETLVEYARTNGDGRLFAANVDARPLAVVGLRSCDLHALLVQDRVFLDGPYVDPGYAARRRDLFIVAVNCRRPAPTCFCHSLNTGPAAQRGFDLALTEMAGRFIVDVGSELGAELMSHVNWSPCTLQEIHDAQMAVAALKRAMHQRERSDSTSAGPAQRQRHLDATDLHDLLLNNLEHPRWATVAQRCMACANCTMVCPTCFCTSIVELSDLSGDHVRRERRWDSCFTAEHSYMNTGSVRKSTASRYRQWLTHKLATWIDQFGVGGCVGCGRCITWCPVGIDLTEEVAAIRGDHA
jgi:ferredoxin